MKDILVKEVKEKIKEAQKALPTIINVLQNIGVEFNYRIKEEKRIEEKILLWERKPRMKSKSKLEILNLINDILGITIVVDKVDYIPNISKKVVSQIEEQLRDVKLIKYKDRLTDVSIPYKRIHLIFDYQKMPFEIQITDKDNLYKRSIMHNNYEQIKYACIRNNKCRKS